MKLDIRQSQDMVSRGYNPLSQVHIEHYLTVGTPTKEMLQENLLRIGGRNALKKPINYKKERDIDLNNFVGQEGIGNYSGGNDYNTDPRQLVREAIDNYDGRSVGVNRNSRFEQQSNNIQLDPEVENLAENFYKNLNAILKTKTSYNDWMNLYGNLKKLLLNIKDKGASKRSLDTLEQITKEFYNQL